MKTLLPADFWLRGPRGLHDWFAYLPEARRTRPANSRFTPHECSVQPGERSPGLAAAYCPSLGRFGVQLVLIVFSLLLEKFYRRKIVFQFIPVVRPGQRRRLGVLALLLLSGGARASAGRGAPLATEPAFTTFTQSPAASAVPYGAPVTVTASFDGQVTGGRNVYLRYSTDNFATCTVVGMADVSGGGHTGFAATVPNLTSSPAKPIKVSYYAFTSSLKAAPTTCGSTQAGALALSATNTFSYGVPFTGVSVPTTPTNCGHLITATLAAAPAATNENFYLRFTTDPSGSFGAAGAITQTLAMAVAGTAATATIPASAPGATITYYAFSSTAATPAAATSDPALVLQYGRNAGANYRFVTPQAVSISALTAGSATCANGNNGEATFTVGGGTPGSYAFQLATNGGLFQTVAATKPAGDERYHIGGLVAGSRYQVRVSDGCLSATAANSVTIGSSNPAPTATLSNNGPVCTGGATTVSIDLTGVAPWSLTYSYVGANGSAVVVSRNGIPTSPFILSADNLAVPRAYTLTQLSDANGCAAQNLPLSTTVAVNPPPTVTLNPITRVCAGTSALLTGRLTGAGPWKVYYIINGVSQLPKTVSVGTAGQTSVDLKIQTPTLTKDGANTITITRVDDATCEIQPGVVATVEVVGATTWTGNSKNGEWTDGGNWTNCIPSQYLNAVIPALTNGNPYPSFTTASGQTTAEVKDLAIEAGASLTYTAGTLALYGNLTNNGTLKLTQSSGLLGLGPIVGAVVSLNGSANQTISNLGEVYDLVVNTSNGATAALSGNVRVDRSLSAIRGVLNTGTATITLASDQLTTEGTATISESDASYVSGIVKTQRLLSLSLNTAGVSSTFGGLGLSLMPSGLVALGLTTVTRYTGPAAALSIAGRPSVARWFRIAPAVDAGLNVALTFNYFEHERNGVASANPILFSTPSAGTAPPAGPWTPYANSSVTLPSGGGYGTVTVSGLSHLSDWAMGERPAPLPVELSRFEARRAGPDAELSWTTASEQNCRGFQVQVSADGQQFRELGFVPSAAGNSHSPRTYAYQDREAAKAGPRYYRLRQTDHDGAASFSPVRVVGFGEVADRLTAQLSAVPNPFGRQLWLRVQAPEAASARLTITDVAGRLVRSPLISWPAGQSQQELPGLAGLPAGVYLLQVPLAGKTQHLRLVKE